MGLIGTLYSAVTGRPSGSHRALLDILCLASRADGAVSRVERGYLIGIALDLPGYERCSRGEIEDWIDETMVVLEGESSVESSMQRIVASLDSALLREQAFTLAAVIEHADQNLSTEEHRFLEMLRTSTGLSDQRARTIVTEIEKELAQLEGEGIPGVE